MLVIPERLGLRSSRIHYIGPIPPPRADEPDGDRRHMDVLVDHLERYVGRLRDQFPHPVGWERRWDREREAWVDMNTEHRPA